MLWFEAVQIKIIFLNFTVIAKYSILLVLVAVGLAALDL